MDDTLKISAIEKIYFVGIGGIGMSALARYFNHIGKEIYGYDKVNTVLTRKLEDEGMKIHYDDNPDKIPNGIGLVVYTPAIPKQHKELNWFIDNGFHVKKRSEVLGMLSREKKTIAVAGTHGKTSTSSLISHILTYSGLNPTAFIGGILKNYNSNFLQGKGNWLVVEADEYDRSFHTLQPEITVLISVDPDHLDIYGDHHVMLESFRIFLEKTKNGGSVIVHKQAMKRLGDEVFEQLQKREIEIIPYDINEDESLNQWLEKIGGSYFFKGQHNRENAIAAMMVGKKLMLDEAKLLEGLENFSGIKRRFEKVYESGDILYVDDYAHHPTELKAAIEAIRNSAGERQVLGIFQPHLFSRTRDFEDEFAESLDRLDEIVLLEIYPAREEPIPGVSSKNIFDKMKSKNKFLLKKSDVIEFLTNRKIEVIVTLGAGDIDTCVPQIKKLIENN
jgi:UDP-N-acetylmuramate--alanine ligase